MSAPPESTSPPLPGDSTDDCVDGVALRSPPRGRTTPRNAVPLAAVRSSSSPPIYCSSPTRAANEPGVNNDIDTARTARRFPRDGRSHLDSIVNVPLDGDQNIVAPPVATSPSCVDLYEREWMEAEEEMSMERDEELNKIWKEGLLEELRCMVPDLANDQWAEIFGFLFDIDFGCAYPFVSLASTCKRLNRISKTFPNIDEEREIYIDGMTLLYYDNNPHLFDDYY